MKKIISCVLVLAMMLGTCSTTFALKINGVDAMDFVESKVNEATAAIDAAKAEIDTIIDIIESGDNEAIKDMAADYATKAEDAIVGAGLVEQGKIDSIKADVAAGYNQIKDIVEAPVSDDEKIDQFIGIVEGELGIDVDNDEVKDVIDIVKNQDDEAALEKINFYKNIIMDSLDITDEDVAEVYAMIADLIADVVAFAEEVKDLPYDEYAAEIKAMVNDGIAKIKAQAGLQLANLGHKHYEKAENSYYVAIGGDTVYGTGIGRADKAYFDLVAKNYDDVATVAIAEQVLLPSEMVAYIEDNAAEIAKADLITYQMDASSIIYATLTDTPDWEKYLGVDIQVVIDEVMAQAELVLAEDWAAEGGILVDDAIATIKANVNNNLPEWVEVEESDIDAIVAFCAPAIEAALAGVANAQNTANSVYETVDGIMANEMVMDYAKKAAYAVVSLIVETKAAIEAIQDINPDATLVVLGMYNPANGLEIAIDGNVVAVEEFVEYAIDFTNIYYSVLAAANKNFAFVDISDAETNGFAQPIVIDLNNLDSLATEITTLGASMHANAAGHAYIADQIVKALTCDYSKYVVVDEETHALVCAICGDVKLVEAHDGNPCSKCGFTKEIAPTPTPTPTPGPSYGYGGGGGSVKPTPTPEAKPDVTKFADLDTNAWYYEYVKKAYELGLMVGVSDTEFGPHITLTRGMFVTVLHRIEGATPVEADAEFVDVPADMYYTEAVKWAKANGIVAGVSETEFAPDLEVTREQMAAMISRYATFKGLVIPEEGEMEYIDAESISDFAKESVKVTNKLGLLVGTGDGNFAPLNNASRAEAAALFVRLLDVLAK